jgi:murein L,D-transpeptidase YcbB/YkuD
MTNVIKKRLTSSLLVLLMTGATGFGAFVWSPSSSSQASSLSAAQMFERKEFYAPKTLQVFYQGRDMKPLWHRGQGSFQPRLEAIVVLLEESWTHGLNPEKYHVSKIRELIKKDTADTRQELDLVLSDAVVRYGRDLTGMRDRNSVRQDQLQYWRQPMQAEAILERVSTAADPIKALRQLEPNGSLYYALRRELIALSSSAATDPAPITIKTSIKPGKTDPKIASIRERFGIVVPTGASENFYDDELAGRIMTLQRDYGLKDDGVITQETVAILNKTKEDKLAQIVANMERLRWIDQDRPSRYVLVNIPSASLWAVNKDEVVLEMPVIIGKSARPTYSFKTEITGVRFNPNWTVPPTIKRADFLPMLQNDPNALAKRGIRMVHNGKTIDPASVDWGTVGSKTLHSIRMVQNPGDDNPLGKVRVIMENPYNIYLHDTNKREMFDQRERALSSGCIRVSQPEKLADFILSTNDGWSWNGMQKMIDSGRMRDVDSEQKLPVFITYQTIWLDSNGKLVYGKDVYGQDQKLYKILKNTGGIHIPLPSEKAEISL